MRAGLRKFDVGSSRSPVLIPKSLIITLLCMSCVEDKICPKHYFTMIDGLRVFDSGNSWTGDQEKSIFDFSKYNGFGSS